MKEFLDKKALEKLFGNAYSLNVPLIVEQLGILEEITKSAFSNKSSKISVPNVCNETNSYYSPKSIKQTFENLFTFFDECPNWRSPKTLYNITPPPIIPSITAQILVDMLNPTLVTRSGGGRLLDLEKVISDFLSDLAGWESNNSLGLFTFGGTGTNLYGMKVGLNKCDPKFSFEGARDVVFIDNEETHSCHRTACDWLGVGINNDIILKTYNGVIDPQEFRKAAVKVIQQGFKIAGIMLNGGESYDYMVDPIKEVYDIRNELVEEYQLEYSSSRFGSVKPRVGLH